MTVFSATDVGKTGHPGKRIKLDPYLLLHIKMNSKYNKYLKLRSKTVSILEEKYRVKSS